MMKSIKTESENRSVKVVVIDFLEFLILNTSFASVIIFVVADQNDKN